MSYTIIKAQLKADFSISVVAGCAPLLVQFTDSSQGNPTSIEWNLGNGIITHVNNPQVIYDVAGTYNIKLIINDGIAEDSITKTITVYANPSVDFSASPLTGCPPLQTLFTGTITAGSGNIVSSLWDFGDGQIFNGNNPSHTYNLSGSFGITLTVKNSFGCTQTAFKDNYIHPDPSASADFTYTYSNACIPPTNVSFTSANTNIANATYQWQFGDNNTSTNKNPEHIFQQKGNFIVKLTTTSPDGCTDTSSKMISIGSVTADFITPSICAGEPATFFNNSTPLPISATWSFGDGKTAGTIDATHSFAVGIYKVTMTGQFGACNGSVTKTIQVSNKPKASFSVTNASGCSYPRSVTFKNTSTGAANYKWFFGDGDSSTSANPTHVFKELNTFTITLIAYNINGCLDTLTKDSAVQISPPKITSFTNLPARGCTPFTVNPQANIYSPDPITFYEWDFGDGQKSNIAAPEHIYTKQGYYKVTLIVRTNSGCSDTLILNQAVSAGSLSSPDFKADITDVCAQIPVSFKDLSTGKITSWTWDFGDQQRSSQQNPTHLFKDTGYFTVILYISNTGCPAQILKKNYIHVKPPVAIIQKKYLCNASNEISFTNKSIGAKNWQWDFGDNETSTDENPTHSYSLPGEYFVKLTVQNKNCTGSIIDTVNLIKSNIHFNYASSNKICRNYSVSFASDTASYIKNYNWNFGDGEVTKNDTSFTKHFYDSSGVLNPFLILTYTNGCIDTIAAPEEVRVYGPYAHLDTVSKSACKGMPLTFVDKNKSDNVHAINEYKWNFGDSKQQTYHSKPFIHTYDSAGIFPVSLVITDTYGCKDSAFKDSAIVIDELKADFSISDSLSCTPSPVSFINNSYGANVKYLWNFNDGSSSTDSIPQHRFRKEGLFDISLKATDKNGCADSLVKSKSITIKDPVALFTLPDTFAICPPLLVKPQNKSVNFDSLTWDFDDNAISALLNPIHNYVQGGNYNISLIAKGYGNCYDTVYKKLVLMGPSGKFNFSPFVNCKPASVNFAAQTKNAIKYLWDYGNGVVTETTDPFTKYIYRDPGIYIPKLLITDAVGCVVKASNTDSISITDVQANFNFAPQQSCDSSLIIFSDSSIVSYGTAKNYIWDFGDGITSAEINPSHYYRQSGLYNVTLHVSTNAGCENSVTFPLQITVPVSPHINITSSDSVCINTTIHFNAANTAKDTVTSWQWIFSDGLTATSQNPIHSFKVPGTYTVVCKVVTIAGCIDTASKIVTVLPQPAVNGYSDTIICKGNSIKLNVTGANSYTWLNDTTLSCINCSSPVAIPAATTTYYVTGYNAAGCSAADSIMIKVKQPFALTAISPDTLCAGSTVQLIASGAEIYNWQPAAGLSNTTIFNPFASPVATTTYIVTGTDSLNCFTQKQQVIVQVFPKPVFNIIDTNITTNIGTAITIATTNSPDIIKWQWQPPFGLSCNDCPQPVAHPPASVTYIATATNAGNCTTQDKITFKVLCNGASIFVPNTFSPNRDGMNDRFYPRSRADFQIKSFRIFNRWGTEVFEKLNPSGNASDGWDGIYLGKPAAEDVYIFTIEVICMQDVYQIKGTITLIR